VRPGGAQNVVTYAAVIDVENPDLKLKPGMTATVTVEVARRTDALIVPAAALRFKPTTAMLAARAALPPWVPSGGAANCTLWFHIRRFAA
jgi:multidrug efflux pump subunit AcrA (membrane-fusion protein)